MASKDNPEYTVYAVASGVKYDLTPITEAITITDQKKQMAKSVVLELANIKLGDTWMSSILMPRDRIFIYADDGEQKEEVFRGFVWTRKYQSSLSGYNLRLLCYDNLIYWQESQDHLFFADGKSTKDILSTICESWGITMSYEYESITHSKLALRGTLSDIITSDILDLVKDRTGKKYVILSEKDQVIIRSYGSNSVIYEAKAGNNTTKTTSEYTMDDMTTKVIIYGKADDDDRQPVEATLSGNTEKYGTLQKIINRSTNTSLADAKKEAQSMLGEDGTPKWEYTVELVDIPWIRKGDKVKVAAGDIVDTLIAVSIDRDISNKGKTMTLTLEKP